VGLILKAFGIKKAIEEGMQFYDFLRGDERYKYDLGAMDSMLNKIEITLEG
jgi:CelD/BcsL family acetyltransferase involved in cellulose biosynthesis